MAMGIYDLIDELGEEKVLDEILRWLDTDTIEEICEDITKNFDLDVEMDEDFKRSWGPQKDDED